MVKTPHYKLRLKEMNAAVKYSYVLREVCPACGSGSWETLFEEAFGEGKTYEFIRNYYNGRIGSQQLGSGRYQLVRCPVCTLIYQRAILDEAGLSDLYERAIDPIESLNKRELASQEYFAEILKNASVAHHFFKPATARDIKVLDFGMGWGHWVLAANALGLSAAGAELSEERIAFAQMHGVQVVKPFEPHIQDTYRFINTDQVFEHIDEPEKTLRELASLLRKNGIIKIFVPNTDPIYRRLKAGQWVPGKDAFHPLEHINSFNFSSLKAMARRSGLSPLRTEEVSTTFFENIRFKKRLASNVPSWFFRRIGDA